MKLEDAIRAQLKAEESSSVYRYRHSNGEWRWLESTGQPFWTSTGEIRVVISSRDITDRRKAEEKLLERHEQLHLLYNLNDTVSRAKDLVGIYEEALDGLTRVLNLDRAAILIADTDGIMRFKAWQGISEEYRKAVDGHSPWSSTETNPEPILISDVEKEASLGSLQKVILGEGIAAVGFIPLKSLAMP